MNKENLLIEFIWPIKNTQIFIKNIILVLVGTIVISISAKIQIPFWPVPMTMQTYAVLVIAMIYGTKLAFLTLLAYLIEGAIGIPVFAKGGGIMYLTGPTAGYLYGMLIAAGLVGFYSERGFAKSSIANPRFSKLLNMSCNEQLTKKCCCLSLNLLPSSVPSLGYSTLERVSDPTFSSTAP